jgi:hypothetical protein
VPSPSFAIADITSSIRWRCLIAPENRAWRPA